MHLSVTMDVIFNHPICEALAVFRWYEAKKNQKKNISFEFSVNPQIFSSFGRREQLIHHHLEETIIKVHQTASNELKFWGSQLLLATEQLMFGH